MKVTLFEEPKRPGPYSVLVAAMWTTSVNHRAWPICSRHLSGVHGNCKQDYGSECSEGGPGWRKLCHLSAVSQAFQAQESMQMERKILPGNGVLSRKAKYKYRLGFYRAPCQLFVDKDIWWGKVYFIFKGMDPIELLQCNYFWNSLEDLFFTAQHLNSTKGIS